jgi:hypothetical protein
MKSFGYTLNILNNSNRAVSSSESDWSAIREGSLVCFGEDEVYYITAKTNPFFYIKEFEVLDGARIVIKDNVDINLVINDVLDVSYKEYELVTIYKTLNAGQGYKAGDLLYAKGGLPSTNVVDGQKIYTVLKVEEVSSEGAITRISISNKGKYITVPHETVITTEGGSGKNAEFEIEYKTVDNRTILERDIVSIVTGPETIITLNYPLPEGVKSGKLSVHKWEMFLTTNYSGKSKLNADYNVVRDYTPNYNFPFLVKGNLSPEVVFNHAMSLIDKKLKELEDKITSSSE